MKKLVLSCHMKKKKKKKKKTRILTYTQTGTLSCRFPDVSCDVKEENDGTDFYTDRRVVPFLTKGRGEKRLTSLKFCSASASKYSSVTCNASLSHCKSALPFHFNASCSNWLKSLPSRIKD